MMKEEDQEEEQKRKEKEEENQNLFALEIQYQQDIGEETQQVQGEVEGGEKNIVNQMETDLKEMRKQMREELDGLIS